MEMELHAITAQMERGLSLVWKSDKPLRLVLLQAPELKYIKRAQGYQEIVAGQVLSKIPLSILLKLERTIMVRLNRDL
jgi:hypothetical protein